MILCPWTSGESKQKENGGYTEVLPPPVFKNVAKQILVFCLERSHRLTQAIRAERLDVVAAVER